MADFEAAFQITMKHEGGYADDPDDAGGETYRGVSRVNHPEWNGWDLIDQLKGEPDPDARLKSSPDLQRLLRQFYRDRYWHRCQGDAIIEQAVADELFDTAVNMGVRRAVTFLQQGLNCLNRNGHAWADMAEDGSFGPVTQAALQSCLEADPAHYLLTIMNILQGRHYIELMSRHQSQEKYARGWLERVRLVKERGRPTTGR